MPKSMAGGLGFEPRLAESESAVLPLDDPPKIENHLPEIVYRSAPAALEIGAAVHSHFAVARQGQPPKRLSVVRRARHRSDRVRLQGRNLKA